MTRHSLLLLFAAGLALVGADARAGITRCTGADGIAVYTDRGCDAMGAQPTAMPATLLRTLARDAGQSVGLPGSGSSLALGELRPVEGSADGNHPRSYAGCPRTPEQLEAAFQESVATGDVNELAAIYDWSGVSGRQSRALMRRLERLSDGRAQGYATGGYRRRAGCLLLAL